MVDPDIETDRLHLTRLRTADAEAMFAYRSIPEVSRYQNWAPLSLEDAVTFIETLRSIEFDSPGTWFQLGIRLRESGALIGDLGVHFLEDGAQVEIGFTLAPHAQGRGLGIEAVTALLDFLLGTLRKHRVFASTDPRNERSICLLQRVGMRQEALHIQSVRFRDGWVDDLVFAVLGSEWNGRSPIR